MTLRIGSSLSGGIGRVLTRNGLVLVVAALAVGLPWTVAFNSLFVQWLGGMGLDADTAATGMPTVALPTAVLAALGVLLLLVFVWLNVVAIRTFVSGRADGIPREFLTRRIGWVLVNSFVAGILVSLAVGIGTILLLVPGIIAYVALVFTPLFVAVDDENAVTALRKSWRLTRGNWIRLFVLLLVLFVVVGLGSAAFNFAVTLLAGPANPAGQLVTSAVSYLVSFLTLGVLAEAFTQLRADATPRVDEAPL